MFDLGFSELMVIAVVALIVVGPERLPKVARTMGHLFGRLQRYVNDVKADISREMELDELRKFKDTMEEAARSMETSIHSEASKAESELSTLARLEDPNAPTASDAKSPGAPPPPTAEGETAHPVQSQAGSPAQLDLGLDDRREPARGSDAQKSPA